MAGVAKISLIFLWLGAVLAVIVPLAGFAAYRLAKRAKWQVSLRALFGLVTAIAVVLAVFSPVIRILPERQGRRKDGTPSPIC
jgi:hypothetical protein